MRDYFAQTWRFLTFRRFAPAPADLPRWIAWGLLWTWLAGIGRYWDHPRALWWQTLGLGSLAYVLFLATLLWLLLAPLRPRAGRRWSEVLLFVTMTAPPALLYAVPVERYMPLEQAASVNAWFLALVASWRVALWARFLTVAARLRPGAVLVMTLLPLTAIVTALAALNLEHVVFSIMSGIREHARSSADAAYAIVFGLTLLSWLVLPAVLVAYLHFIWRAYLDSQRADTGAEPSEYVPPNRRG